jgi:hypothetical protein
MTTENKIKSFPSEFAPQTVKNSEQYCQKYAEAFHTEAANQPSEAALSRNNKSYKRFRQYGRGEQSQLQYKELMGLKRESGKLPNTSFRNLNWEILKVAPKVRNVVVNKVTGQKLRMKARPIDPRSISERRKYKSKLLEFIVNKDEIERLERLTKLGLERPVPEGEAPPANAAEIDPYIDMNPKDITSMEVLDFLTLSFAENDWDQQGREIAGDLVDIGVAGTRQYIDVDNKIKFRRIIADNSVTNKCIYPDFRDMIRFGEYRTIPLGQLRKETKGKWGEDVYKTIANQVSGNQYSNQPESYYDRESYTYAYDHENVTVMDCLWYSTDTETHVEYYNESGNRRVKQESFDYVPFRGDKNVNDGKGMSDEEYNKFNEGKKRIMRTESRNVYQCTWVVDSKYVYNHGLMKNMLRPASNWQQSVLPVVLITTDFMSPMSIIEQPLDQVQLNYLQYQSHVAASKPPGIAIEKHALARVGKGGQGGKKWDPKEDLEMYAETGNFVYDGYDAQDNPLNQHPFQELKNGLSPGAPEHFNLMIQWIDVIKQFLGINDLTEGQTPPERMGKKVAELSFGASDNAMGHIKAAYKSIYEKTARNMFYLLQNNVQRMDPGTLSESLGSESYKYFMLNKDLGLLDMGIILEEVPDAETRERISNLLQLMVENQEIPGEDAVMIEMIDNPYRQILLLRKHRLEREKRAMAAKENDMRVQGEENTKTAVEAEKAKQDTAAQEHERKMEEKQFEAQVKLKEKEMDQAFELMMKRMEMGAEMEQSEKDLMNKILETLIKAQTDITKERMKPKPKPAKATK